MEKFFTILPFGLQLLSMASGSFATLQPGHSRDEQIFETDPQNQTHLVIGKTIITDDCPCSNASWCGPLQFPLYGRKEVYGFSLKTDDWKHYDWSVITTMAWFDGIEHLPIELICYAHQHQARVVFTTSIPESLLQNNTTSQEQRDWARQLVEKVNTVGGDGLNLDYEYPVSQHDVAKQEAITYITNEIQILLKDINPYSSLVWDFGWKPNVDMRYYQYQRMADICDYVFLMVYDTQSQVWDGPLCHAAANSPKIDIEKTLQWYGTVIRSRDDHKTESVQDTKALNIPYEKIILGLPWYGYYYHCTDYDSSTQQCTIPTVPFRGAPCSDAAGKQIDYPFTMAALKEANAVEIYDSDTLSMKAFVTSSGNTTAYYYDSPKTICDKIAYAWDLTDSKLGGVGMWNADVPDYTNKEQVKAFWQAMVVPPVSGGAGCETSTKANA